MYRPRIIPVLLLYKNGLYKTRKFAELVYVGDPMNAVKIFNDLKADELLVLDIEATKNKSDINYNLLEKISEEAFMPFSYGGGLNSLDKIKRVFDSGSEKIAINSASYQNYNLLNEAAKIYGSQAVICSVDVKKINGVYHVFSNSGNVQQEVSLEEHLKNCEKSGAGEIFLNSIDEDGGMNGYDLQLYKQVSNCVSIPLIASGGAGDEDDLKKVIEEGGAAAAAAGSLFVFMGSRNSVMINYPDKEELNDLFS